MSPPIPNSTLNIDIPFEPRSLKISTATFYSAPTISTQIEPSTTRSTPFLDNPPYPPPPRHQPAAPDAKSTTFHIPHDTPLGDDHYIKEADSFRFAFNNCNGISLSPISLQFFLSVAQDLQIDWLGIAKTHLDSEKPHVRAMVKNTLCSTSGFSMVNCVFSAGNVDYGTDWKPGGTFQVAVENLATRTISSFSDKYGRFTSQTHTGCNGLTTISGY